MISTSASADLKVIVFDEFRANIQQVLGRVDTTIKELKRKDEAGDSSAKALLYLFQGVFLILEGEKKYRSGDYSGATMDYTEGGKMLNRFQRMSSGFSMDYHQAAERLDQFSKGRRAECLALKEGTKIENQVSYLIEAINAYSLESEINQKFKNPLLFYNSKARENFVRGLSAKFEGEDAFKKKDYRLAKKKHLEAYRSFITAAYYNPSYSIWLAEQKEAIKNTLNVLLEVKASLLWKEAFGLSNEGKFLASSKKCRTAAILFLRASNLSSEIKKAKLLYAFSFMLKSNMYEANANDFLKKKNNPKGSIRQFELAAQALRQAIDSYPNKEEEKALINRWEAQQKYYFGHFFQSQGITDLDAEKYQEALTLFTQASEQFTIAAKNAKEANDKKLVDLVEKSIAEAEGFIGMCKTVLG